MYNDQLPYPTMRKVQTPFTGNSLLASRCGRQDKIVGISSEEEEGRNLYELQYLLLLYHILQIPRSWSLNYNKAGRGNIDRI